MIAEAIITLSILAAMIISVALIAPRIELRDEDKPNDEDYITYKQVKPKRAIPKFRQNLKEWRKK
jgi:hypothetical protein